MVFASVTFLFYFLPIAILLYALLPARNAVALALSLVFYAWGEGVYVLLLLGVVASNYLSGRLISRFASRLWPLAIGVAVNLGVLAYFKYFGFLINDVLSLGDGIEPPHLPLGISFFIFQSISYLVDVYRGDARPARGVLDLALYITMFPQLIAGPIVRYASVSETIRHRHIDLEQVMKGAALFVLGLAQKLLVANNMAEIADTAYAADLSTVDFTLSWLGTLAYTLQIFFDFAGYSLMAIGLGRIMGFTFPQNFNYPYISRSVTEFWRRWHISLSSWFRDYLYIPLGGNRKGPMRTYFNLVTVFFLCGLWHGASWTFIVWGLFHGLLLVVERLGLGRVLSALPPLLANAYTLFVVIIGWVLFRAENFTQATVFLKAMFLGAAPGKLEFAEIVSNENLFFALIGIVFSTPLISRLADRASTRMRSHSPAVAYSAGTFLYLSLFAVCVVYVMSGTYNPFIYFRF
jgi:alginate O-acetyltransferase complex protein AlgI